MLCGRVMVPAAAMRMLAGTAIGAVMEKQMNKTIGAAALVAAVAVSGTALADDVAKPTIVLVHGAFADASGWYGVITQLNKDGYKTIAATNPLRTLSGDAATVASLLKSIKGDVVLVGHSYGGEVITEAASGQDNVKALVYVDGFMPDVGEAGFPLSAGTACKVWTAFMSSLVKPATPEAAASGAGDLVCSSGWNLAIGAP